MKGLMQRFWKSWGKDIILALLVVIPFRSSIADWNVVPTGSMLPTIVEGDRVLVNKLAWDLKVPLTTTHIARWSDPEPGDIAVFFSPQDGTRLVKRVVGTPGDQIELQQNRLIINGEAVDIDLLNQTDRKITCREVLGGHAHRMQILPRTRSMRNFGPVAVPEGMYFMLGDNRDNSADSRYFGFVPRNNIVGKATHVVMSLDHSHSFLPRWQRFFTKLL